MKIFKRLTTSLVTDVTISACLQVYTAASYEYTVAIYWYKSVAMYNGH